MIDCGSSGIISDRSSRRCKCVYVKKRLEFKGTIRSSAV